jgi:predicted Zn-ribbon and HTH transcriptional regulator
MTIIFNELEYAEKLFEKGFSRFMSKRDLFILAKYFRHMGENDCEIEKSLIDFCTKFEPEFSEIIFAKKIENVIKESKDRKLRIPVDVPITSNELDIIKSIKNYRYEKVLFTMLVLGKYYKLTNTSNLISKSKQYYIKDYPQEIFKLAHVSQKNDENIMHILYKLGLINNNKVSDSYYLMFTTTEDNSNIEIIITNINKILDFYPPYCEDCGAILKNKSKMHSKCLTCYEKYRKNVINNNAKRYYNEKFYTE